MSEVRKSIVIGSGPAGLTAALYLARANLAPVVFEGQQPGGQLTITTEVENFPGFEDGIQGPELMEIIRKQAQRFGAESVYRTVTAVEFGSSPFKVTLDNGDVVESHSVVISTGSSAKWLGLEGETRLQGKGVSACATCDGFFFKDENVVVVGGGDTAMEEALFLTKFAESVTVIHRRDELRASKVMQDRAFKNDKIQFEWDSQVVELIGEDGVTAVKVKNLKTDEEKEISATGYFAAIGHTPNTDIFEGVLDMDENGYLVTHDDVLTTVEGVYACGDVQDHVYRQAITAAGSGCMAAIRAERWLAERGIE
jgi:thioredoxin reductase (NADPH)